MKLIVLINLNLIKQKADDNYFSHRSFKSVHKLDNYDQNFKNVGLDIKEARKSNSLKQWQIMEMFDILKQNTKINENILQNTIYFLGFLIAI